MEVVVEIGTKQLDGVQQLQNKAHAATLNKAGVQFNELVMAKWFSAGILTGKPNSVVFQQGAGIHGKICITTMSEEPGNTLVCHFKAHRI